MEENSRLLMSEPKDEIVFTGPYEKGSQTSLKLCNPGQENVYFKVLTTDPLAFCVKPKMGCVLPGETTYIYITLRNEDPKYYLDKQPKFKVLTLENSGKEHDPKTLWSGDKMDNLSSLRFSCNFTNPVGDEDKAKAGQDPHGTDYENSGCTASMKESKQGGANKVQEGTSKSSFTVKFMILGAISILIISLTAAKLFLGEPIIT